ncbi:hypothetical protein [Sphingobium cloacae]|uniref:Uncharacterized protein n=1 Tax=Sphingobium cloacae TaxID=120107 RepID=A0A1E1F6X6_9SPHN|nr:hypothetical protein [Sphingobium cloacae]BAV66276.1 hypothetical protein SCLO_1032360 [Sphingobium cloacae]
MHRLTAFNSERRTDAKQAVRDRYASTVVRITPSGRERWNSFVDQVAGIPANLEASSSQYSLLARLHGLRPGELDQLDGILADWGVATAKLALDEIQSRLRLINELHDKLRDERADEVREVSSINTRMRGLGCCDTADAPSLVALGSRHCKPRRVLDGRDDDCTKRSFKGRQ